jgi:hypothetical protein
MSATPKPIEWAEGRHSSFRGTVGETELFTISLLTDRSGRYTIQTVLPLYCPSLYDTEELAKNAATRLLAKFVERITD